MTPCSPGISRNPNGLSTRQELHYFLFPQGTAVQKSLIFITPLRNNEIELLLGFHALGNRHQTQTMGKKDYRRDNCPAFIAILNIKSLLSG